MTMGIATVAAITALVYIVGLWIKNSKLDNKWIPVICGGFGAALGVVGYLTDLPNFPAEDSLSAAAVGSVSGLAATGIDQMIRQMKNPYGASLLSNIKLIKNGFRPIRQ